MAGSWLEVHVLVEEFLSTWLLGCKSGGIAAKAAKGRAAQYRPRVYLVATPIGPRLPKVPQAFHTSVLLDGVEHAFGATGIVSAQGPQSHRLCERYPKETKFVDMGYSRVDAADFAPLMREFFRERTYDLLRKNCNSFSDVVLADLTGQRLDARYRSLEQVAHTADKYIGFVQALTGGIYKPNRAADDFVADQVIATLRAGRRSAARQLIN